MRLTSQGMAAFVMVLGLAACQSSAGTNLGTIIGPATDAGASTGRLLDGGGGGDVRITIVSPKAMDVIKGGASAQVTAKVESLKPGTAELAADPIDPASVAVSLRDQLTNNEVASGPLFGPNADSQFVAPFDLSKAVSGDYQLIVTAATRGGSKGIASIAVRLDLGPHISIVNPKDGGSYKGGVTVEVLIDSAPFNPTMNVTASIGPVMVPLARTAAPNTYEGTVDFLNATAPLDGDQVLVVTAVNNENTQTTARVRFTIDNKGPTFSMTEPQEGAVVGGIIRVRAKVDDPKGVQGDSVEAVIGNRADVNFTLKLKPEGQTGFYSELFDTSKLTSCKPLPDTSLCVVFPNLSFRASDLAANSSTIAYDFGVDNQPPIVDLFPPPDLRIIRYDPVLKRLVCSWAFDPLGEYQQLGDMPNDLCAVPQVFDLRARIQDDGNRADGLKHAPLSGVDPATTSVYVLGDTSKPLVVDVDGDGVCDAINPILVPTTQAPTMSNQVLAVRLVGVPPKGAGDFTPDPSLMFPNADYPGCSQAQQPTGPRRLCGSEDLTVVIGMPAARGPDPAIWAIEPITGDEPWCVGSQFDSYANQIPEGWACIAAAATDHLGNSGVSQPMRVWIQRRGLPPGGATCPAPPANAGPPPDCTGTYNRLTGQPGGGTCHARAFPAHEILNEGALPEGMGAP
jgi:hypothetical protein